MSPAPPPRATVADQAQRGHVQSLGKLLVSQLFMVLRTVRIHDKQNKSVLVATEHLKDTLNTVLGVLGVVKLEFVEDQVYLSDQRIRIEDSSVDSVREMAKEFDERGLGGFTFTRPVNSQSLTELLVAFTETGREGENAANALRDRLTDLRDLAVELLGRRAFVDHSDAQIELKIKIDPRLSALQSYAKASIGVKRFVDDIVVENAQARGSMQLKLVRVVQDLVDMAFERVNLLLKLVAIKDATDYQYNHAVNVCVLAISLGHALGMERSDLVDLGMAAIMSDLGFALTKPELLDKAGALDDRELSELQGHVLQAVRVLLGKGTLSKSAMRRLVVAFQHHIHFDLQGGYPKLPVKRPLHLFSRIVAICDVYDALTTNRPWREAYSPDEALKILNEGAGSKFDPVLVRVFINILGLYPIGTVVRLSSGEVGIVYHTTDDPARFDRPFVRILRAADGAPMERTLIRDLTEQQGGQFRYSIVETVDAAAVAPTERASMFTT
ncbi:MAG: HD domain-containing phosphohydrolase [Pseudomonadota bacterium]